MAAPGPDAGDDGDLFAMLDDGGDDQKDIVGDASTFDFGSYISNQGASSGTSGGGGLFD